MYRCDEVDFLAYQILKIKTATPLLKSKHETNISRQITMIDPHFNKLLQLSLQIEINLKHLQFIFL